MKEDAMVSGEFKASNLICHRIPQRTFKIKGRYFPVCARCTGFYMGALSYFIYTYFFYVEYTGYLIILAILMVMPAFLDGFTQLMGNRVSNNNLRLLTGIAGGVGLGILVKAIKWMILISF